jgi:hypothetical protein
MLGMPSNQAKDAIAYTPRAVLLKARELLIRWTCQRLRSMLIETIRPPEARRVHKGVTSVPRMIPGQVDSVDARAKTTTTIEDQKKAEQGSKRRQPEGLDGAGDGGQVKRKKVKGDLA